MMRTHWATIGFNPHRTEHVMFSFAPRVPDSLADNLLAQKIGELDPFVQAVEAGRDVPLKHVDIALDAVELGASIARKRSA